MRCHHQPPWGLNRPQWEFNSVTMIHNKCLSSRVTSAEGNLLVSLPKSCWHREQVERGRTEPGCFFNAANIESSSAEPGRASSSEGSWGNLTIFTQIIPLSYNNDNNVCTYNTESGRRMSSLKKNVHVSFWKESCDTLLKVCYHQ